jgi:hypothetical protein
VCGKKEEPTVQQNTPPFITSAVIVPENPAIGSRVNLRINAGDNEGDKVTFTVQWFLNDKKIGEGLEFYLSEVEKGDAIYAEITPHDGTVSGEPVKTGVIRIGNTPPEIIRATISPDAVLTTSDELTVTAEARDMDNDDLSYFCYWTLNRTEKLPDSSTTLPLRTIDLKKGSILMAELYAFDGSATSSPYTLEITVGNAPPILRTGLDSIPYTPESIYYQLPIVDPDNDPLTFEILRGPSGITVDRTQGIIHGQVADGGEFEVLIRATDVEGAYLDAQFTLTSTQ